jgi:hypothetical protein
MSLSESLPKSTGHAARSQKRFAHVSPKNSLSVDCGKVVTGVTHAVGFAEAFARPDTTVLVSDLPSLKMRSSCRDDRQNRQLAFLFQESTCEA